METNKTWINDIYGIVMEFEMDLEFGPNCRQYDVT